MAIFVYVATTQGLVQVQSIIEEDPDIDSVVCLDGGAHQLAISRDYHQFVKKGTGLIHKDFAHGAFRLDVNQSIDSGKSWQLGFYLAHYAQSKSLLKSSEPQAGDIVIWATGEVKIDKSLGAVAGVEQKCQQSVESLSQWQQKGVELLCVLPVDNRGEIQAIDGVEFLPCHSLNEVLSALEGKLTSKSVSVDNHNKHKLLTLIRQPKWWMIAGLLALGFVVTPYAIDLLPVPPPPDVQPSQPSVVNITQPYLNALVKVNGSCDASNREELLAQDFRFTAIRLDRLCQLRLVLTKGNTQVLGIALDTGGIIPVDELGEGLWDIAVPSSKYQNRDYLLLLFNGEFYNQGRNPLIKQMRRWRWNDKSLSARLVQDWVKQNHWPVAVYAHQLQDD